MGKKRKVIIDTDPGIDDLMALATLNASEELDVLAISTVHGNVPLEYTTRNAQLICDIFDWDVPVYKGSSKPLFYDKKESSEVHGIDGLGNLYDKYRKQYPKKTSIGGGLKDVSDLIMNTDDKITLIAIGPLTNIAKLIMINDDISKKVEEIHIMGGGMNLGNVNELTEFNFFSDSHAAKIVMESGIPIILSPLDLTHTVFFEEDELERLFSKESKALEFVKESVLFYSKLDPYMHDVCSILTLTHAHLFDYKKQDIGLVIGGGIADGQSYIKNLEAVNNTLIASSKRRAEIIKTIVEVLDKKY